MIWLAVILGKEQTYCEKESTYLDPKLYGGAVPTVWVKVVSETEVNCEKRSFEVLLCTQNVRKGEKYVRDALLSYQSTFGSLYHVTLAHAQLFTLDRVIFQLRCSLNHTPK